MPLYIPIPLGTAGVENGYDTRTTSTISFDDGTRTFSIAPTGTDFTFYSGGLPFTSTGDSVVIPDAEGIHFFYFDTSGDLVTTQTFSEAILTTYAYTGAVYWDATNNISLLVAEERHGREIQGALHVYLHNTQHTKWQDGFAPNGVTADGSGDLNSHIQIGVDTGIMWDEDIKHSFAAGTSPLTAPFLYRSGAAGDWRKVASTGFVATTTGSGRAAYNQFTGATWQLTEVTNNQFCLMHLVVLNSISAPFYAWVVGQTDYPTITAARSGANVELQNLKLNGLGSLRNFAHEFLFVASFIVQTSNSYLNTPKSRIRTTDLGESFIDWRLELL